MGVKRYELSEAQWLRIAPLLPGKASDPGRTVGDNRLFVNGFCGCCGRVRTGATCRSAMASGRRSIAASAAGPRPASGNRCSPTLIKDRDNKYLMLDSTFVRAHQQAAIGKGGPKIRRWGVPEAD